MSDIVLISATSIQVGDIIDVRGLSSKDSLGRPVFEKVIDIRESFSKNDHDLKLLFITVDNEVLVVPTSHFVYQLRERTEEDHIRFFTAAGDVAKNALCLRALCGSVVVSAEGNIIGTGYNAPPFDVIEDRKCELEFDTTRKPKSDKTCCVHAEWNAILDAFKSFPSMVEGSSLYFMRIDDDGHFTDAGSPYCTVCSRLALQSGIKFFGLWTQDAPSMIPTHQYNDLSYQYFM